MIAGLFLLLLAAMILPACNIQNNYLYFPSSHVPCEEVLKANHLVLWPPSLKDYRGFVSVNKERPMKGTVIIFHGNAGTAAGRGFYVKELASLGYRVLLAEYPAYGGRRGKLGEKVFVADANETIRLAFEQFGGPIFLMGESLGCGVAAAAARKTSVKIDAVILITPWDTLASVAQSKFPFLPVRLFLTDEYNSVDNLKSFLGRIAIVGAERDEIIPIKHANELYRSLPSARKRMWILKEAGHNDWPIHTDTPWWKELMQFACTQSFQASLDAPRQTKYLPTPMRCSRLGDEVRQIIDGKAILIRIESNKRPTVFGRKRR